jgi:enamine deaminase RidA (YjgF/YER057c/UK114 family)
MIQRVFTPGKTRSTSVVHDGLVFTVANATQKSASLFEQTQSALAFLDASLAKVGASKSTLLQVTVYISDISQKPEMNRAWDAWIDMENPPQRACIGVDLEGDDLVEIVAIAAIARDP